MKIIVMGGRRGDYSSGAVFVWCRMDITIFTPASSLRAGLTDCTQCLIFPNYMWVNLLETYTKLSSSAQIMAGVSSIKILQRRVDQSNHIFPKALNIEI